MQRNFNTPAISELLYLDDVRHVNRRHLLGALQAIVLAAAMGVLL